MDKVILSTQNHCLEPISNIDDTFTHQQNDEYVHCQLIVEPIKEDFETGEIHEKYVKKYNANNYDDTSPRF